MSHSPTATDPHVTVHRWPWRPQEFVSMAVAWTLVAAFGYWILHLRSETLRGGLAVAWLLLTLVAACGAVYYLYRVKKKRCDTSQVTITIRGTVVRAESKGPLGTSQVDVTRTQTVSYRRFGSDETFMINDGSKTLRIPLRTTTDPKVREAVEIAYATAEKKSVEARDLLQQMHATGR